MVSAVQGPDILKRARKSDSDFDDLMRQVDRYGPNVHLLRAVSKGAEVAYSFGYLAGFTAAQGNIREALGIPERD